MLGLEDPFLPALAERVIELMGDAWPGAGRAARHDPEVGGRRGGELPAARSRRASGCCPTSCGAPRSRSTSWIDAEDAFRLHDTFGFPYELTKELLADEGLAVDDQGFEELMERAREVARGGASVRQAAGGGAHERVISFARDAGFPTRFVGYETTEADTVLGALEQSNGQVLAKLAESPFYAEGGGQVSDSGLVETPSGRARVERVYRLGDDQAVALSVSDGELVPGEAAHAKVDRQRRLATMANHTATHLLHAALRQLLGTHVRQAGSYVGPDKLRFDFTHGERLSAAEATAVEELVNEWIVASLPVRAVETTRAEAERLGAMALFGEKYGDWVRMVDVEEVSRELCGGTHVASTAEVGLFHLTHETSSAANVRRIEAVTGPVGIEQFRERTEELREVAAMLRVPEREVVPAVRKLAEQLREAAKRPRGSDRELAESLVGRATEVGGVRVLTEVVDVPDQKALLELSDRVKQSLGDAAVVLGTAVDGRVHLIANFAPAAVERGAKAGRRGARGGPGRRRRRRRARHDGAGRRARPGEAARGGGGRARGDRDRARRMSRVLALDFGEARCGCALSRTPPARWPRRSRPWSGPDTRRGLQRLVQLVRERDVERVVVGLPLSLSGEEGPQALRTREWAGRLAARLQGVPVDLHDERLTTRQAERVGGRADEDSRAAAHLLEAYLA